MDGVVVSPAAPLSRPARADEEEREPLASEELLPEVLPPRLPEDDVATGGQGEEVVPAHSSIALAQQEEEVALWSGDLLDDACEGLEQEILPLRHEQEELRHEQDEALRHDPCSSSSSSASSSSSSAMVEELISSPEMGENNDEASAAAAAAMVENFSAMLSAKDSEMEMLKRKMEGMARAISEKDQRVGMLNSELTNNVHGIRHMQVDLQFHQGKLEEYLHKNHALEASNRALLDELEHAHQELKHSSIELDAAVSRQQHAHLQYYHSVPPQAVPPMHPGEFAAGDFGNPYDAKHRPSKTPSFSS